MGAGEPHFGVPLRRAMKRAGLRGSRAEVRLDGDALVLAGDEGGSLRIPARDVRRIRVSILVLPPPRFATRPRTTLYETCISRIGERFPLMIGPPDDPAGYEKVMREFAGWVFADGGKVLRGRSLPLLVIEMGWTVGAVSVLALFLLGIAIYEGRFWLWAITSFVLALPFYLARRIYRRNWPRRVSRPEQLDEVLPPLKECRR